MTAAVGPVLEGRIVDQADVEPAAPPPHDWFAHQRPHPCAAPPVRWTWRAMLRNDFGVRWWLYTAAAGGTAVAVVGPGGRWLALVPGTVAVIGDWWCPRARAWLKDGPMHHTRG